jgi:hypothetical protein
VIDPIRVRDNATKHEMTIPAERFDKAAFTKLERPALDAHGEPAPVKFHISVAKPAPDTETAKSVNQKEN